MKKLENHVLLYDADCPLCRAYSGAFVKQNMLGNREVYAESIHHYSSFVHPLRAKNEIALVDKKNHTVIYGIDSLFFILENRWPVLKPIFTFKPLHSLMTYLYRFVSYNRKVILPADTRKEVTCAPSFHIGYRLLWIALCTLASSLLLAMILLRLQTFTQDVMHWVTGVFLMLGQLGMQGLVLTGFTTNVRTHINYLGNLMTVSLLALLLLLPALLLNLQALSIQLFLVYGLILFVLQFVWHRRRVFLLQLPKALIWSWAGYWTVLLLSICIYRT